MTYDLQTTDVELMEARNWIIEVSIKRYIFHARGSLRDRSRGTRCAVATAHNIRQIGMITSRDQSNLSPAEME
jgi:hypothetical protein